MIWIVRFKGTMGNVFCLTYATLKAVEINKKKKFVWDKKPQEELHKCLARTACMF